MLWNIPAVLTAYFFLAASFHAKCRRSDFTLPLSKYGTPFALCIPEELWKVTCMRWHCLFSVVVFFGRFSVPCPGFCLPWWLITCTYTTSYISTKTDEIWLAIWWDLKGCPIQAHYPFRVSNSNLALVLHILYRLPQCKTQCSCVEIGMAWFGPNSIIVEIPSWMASNCYFSIR